MGLNKLSQEVHDNAVNKGFYDLPNQIIDRMRNSDIFSPTEVEAVKDAFITQRLMLITSELSEALEANRNKRKAKSLIDVAFLCAKGKAEFKQAFRDNIKDTFEDELADATIRIADLAGWLEIDLDTHVALKHEYNTTREAMHGGKAY